MAEIAAVGAIGAGAFVATNVAPKVFSTGLGARAAQIQGHKMDEIKFRIERQKLYRQDVRDLVQAGRKCMDTYQKVGTLLVSFTLALFTGSQAYASMLNPNSKIPAWIVALFCANNISAIGYLCLSIWLAMHAAVICDSVGARLLTHFARLSIPGREELQMIRTSVVPFEPVRNAKGWATTKLQKLRGKKKGHDEHGQQNKDAIERQRTWPHIEEKSLKSESSDTLHFQKYFNEQRSWLAYDEFSRVCMALGINHLLTTISYFAVGVVWERTIVGGIATLWATQWLMVLLLRLDIADDVIDRALSRGEFGRSTAAAPGTASATASAFVSERGSNRGDAPLLTENLSPVDLFEDQGALMKVCAVLIGPPILAKLIWNLQLLSATGEFLGTACYALHATWLIFVSDQIARHKENNLPHVLRSTRYLDILDGDQRKLAKKDYAKRVRAKMDKLRRLRIQLMDNIQLAMQREERRNEVLMASRDSEELGEVRELLQEEIAMGYLVASSPVLVDSNLREEIRSCELVLERFSVWQMAPDIYAGLGALRFPLVRQYLSEDDSMEAERLFGKFFQYCCELDLGAPSQRRPRTRSATAPEDFTPQGSLDSPTKGGCSSCAPRMKFFKRGSRREHSEHEAFTKRIFNSPRAASPHAGDNMLTPIVFIQVEHRNEVSERCISPLWIDALSGETHSDKPQDFESRQRLTDSDRILGLASQWIESACRLQPLWEEYLDDNRSTEVSDSQISIQGETPDESTTEMPENLMPRGARAPGWMPRVIVQRFSYSLAVMWITAGISHFLLWCTEPDPSHDSTQKPAHGTSLTSRVLKAQWPEPSHLFEISSLHCNNDTVIIGSRFSLHSAHFLHDELRLLREADRETALRLCGPGACGSLALLGGNATARLDQPCVKLAKFTSNEAKGCMSPAEDWDVVTAWPRPCGANDGTASRCQAARLVTWDGKDLVAASAWRSSWQDPWQVQPNFIVQPQPKRYKDIVALSLGGEGHLLFVLTRAGSLDSWNLTNGSLVGHWMVRAQPASMCLAGHSILISYQHAAGPVLETAQMPSIPLQELATPTQSMLTRWVLV